MIVTNKEIETLTSQELEKIRFDREQKKWKRRKERAQEWLQRNTVVKGT